MTYEYYDDSDSPAPDPPKLIGGPEDRGPVPNPCLPVTLLDQNLLKVHDVRYSRAAAALFAPDTPMTRHNGLVIMHLRDFDNLYNRPPNTQTYPVILYCGYATPGLDQTVLCACLNSLNS
jgi:hypothetical protein